MNFNLKPIGVSEARNANVSETKSYAPSEDDSIFSSNKVEDLDTIQSGSGQFDGTNISDHTTDNPQTVTPKDRVVDINILASDEELDEIDEPTFNSFYDLLHDVYGNGSELPDEVNRQILYAIINDSANEEIFKDFLGSEKYQKFLDAYNTEDAEKGYIAMYNMLDGMFDTIDGLTLPDVDIQ